MNIDRVKFRVWDNHCKRYGLPPYISRSGEDCHIYNIETPQENPDLLQHHFVLEQCTGQKDKNGKLIFEGDIVKTAIGEIGVVVFFGAQFAVRFENAFYSSVVEVKEIIGNIHEMESEVKDE